MLPRKITVVVSAAPASTSSSSASQKTRAKPKQAIAAPQITTVTSIARAFAGTRPAGPDRTEPSRPPAARAVLSRPRVCGDPPKRSAFRAGNSATGKPNSVASMSKRNAAVRIGWLRTYRRPSAAARKPGHAVQGRGEADRVDDVAHPKAPGHRDRAGQRGAEQERDVPGHLVQRDTGGEALGGQQPRQERAAGRPVDRLHPGLERSQRVEQPELPEVQECLHG